MSHIECPQCGQSFLGVPKEGNLCPLCGGSLEGGTGPAPPATVEIPLRLADKLRAVQYKVFLPFLLGGAFIFLLFRFRHYADGGDDRWYVWLGLAAMNVFWLAWGIRDVVHLFRFKTVLSDAGVTEVKKDVRTFAWDEIQRAEFLSIPAADGTGVILHTRLGEQVRLVVYGQGLMQQVVAKVRAHVANVGS